jgi:chitinase
MVAGAGRRLSPVRVGLALAVIAGAGYVAVGQVTDSFGEDGPTAAPAAETWFAPYVDVTLDPSTPFEDPTTAPVDDLVLSFVVADADHPCRPSWGGAYSLAEAGTSLELDRRIARVRQREGEVIVSFGGAANDELATVCEDVEELTQAYADVVDRYDVPAIDLDIEAGALADTESATRRGEAIAAVQADRVDADQPLEVWLTLPVDPSGLPDDAVAVIDATLAAGVDLSGVNVMTMDYGESRVEGQSMLDASVAALDAAHGQLAAAYERAGVDLSDAAVWARLGATPMLGQNDTLDDHFSLDDAEGLVAVAVERGLGRLSVWSLNRDLPCGPNDTGLASAYCSGTSEGAGAFTSAFAVVDGHLSTGVSEALAVATGREEVVEDDPATSPYDIWDRSDGYAEGERVVWRRNVYEAKWWNQDTAPDLPVQNAWDTPWRLIGPVLPGDHPIEPELLAEGTHPGWSSVIVYHQGDIVQLDGVAYEAKWWTSGDAPDAELVDPFSSPWEALPVD